MRTILTCLCTMALVATQFTVTEACIILADSAPNAVSTAGSVGWFPPCGDEIPPIYEIPPSVTDVVGETSRHCAPSFPGLIYPVTPDDDDIIQFYEPFEYWHTSCDPWLVPHLSIDREAKVVQISIEAVPHCAPGTGGDQIATLFAIGLYGEFGPLESGLWEYRNDEASTVYSFTVLPEPAVLPLPGLAGLLLRRGRKQGTVRACAISAGKTLAAKRMSVLRTVAAAVASQAIFCTAAIAAPLTYEEPRDGDLPMGAPLPVLPLDLGVNTVSGHFHPQAYIDWDSFAFTIPAGTQLVSGSVELTGGSIGGEVAAYWYLFPGSSPDFTGAILDYLLTAIPSYESASLTYVPLDAGTYNLTQALNEGAVYTDGAFYTFSLTVAEVPEPAAYLAGVGSAIPLLLLPRVARRAAAIKLTDSIELKTRPRC